MYRSASLNQINIPFKYNSIEIKDKRIFGVSIFPVGYPEVQIVLKKIRASAKINNILSANYYDAIFNGRKFIFGNNTLTEITGEGSQYIKVK